MVYEELIKGYLKANILTYFPAVKFLIGDLEFDWDNFERLHRKKLAEREIKLAESGAETMQVTANLYDIIIEVKKENPQAVRFLDFMNKILTHLSIRLTKEEKILVANSSLKNMLTAMDEKYLNFFGEIAVLHNIMNAGKYRLLATNYKHTTENNKDIDFRLQHVDDENIYLVEIVNVHLNDDKVESEASTIKKFINGRMDEKIKDKNKKVTNFTKFELVPVIWGSAAVLKIYSNYFKNNKFDIPNVHEPISYSSFIYQDDEENFFGNFKSISRIFDN